MPRVIFTQNLTYRYALDVDETGERLAFGTTTRSLWVSAGILISLCTICVSCKREAPPPGGARAVSFVAPRAFLPAKSVSLSAFRPVVEAITDTGGECHEDLYNLSAGLHGVVYRTSRAGGEQREVQTALDSLGVIRHYFDLRYHPTLGRTIVSVDVNAGTASASNEVSGQPRVLAVGSPDEVLHAASLGTPASETERVLGICRLFLQPWGALARLPDSLPPPPPPRPEPRFPTMDESSRSRERTLGAGYLGGGDGGFGWLRQVLLPLYDTPGGKVAAWLARGWIAQLSPPQWTPQRIGNWVQTSYETASLPVMTIRSDGWLEIPMADFGIENPSKLWAHRSHLGLGDVHLTLVPWVEHFFHATPTYILSPGPHPLYSKAIHGGSVLETLEGHAYSLSPLEVQGDWMKVRVQWPGAWCGEKTQRTAEGWIRWRDSLRGPLLAAYTDC